MGETRKLTSLSYHEFHFLLQNLTPLALRDIITFNFQVSKPDKMLLFLISFNIDIEHEISIFIYR